MESNGIPTNIAFNTVIYIYIHPHVSAYTMRMQRRHEKEHLSLVKVSDHSLLDSTNGFARSSQSLRVLWWWPTSRVATRSQRRGEGSKGCRKKGHHYSASPFCVIRIRGGWIGLWLWFDLVSR